MLKSGWDEYGISTGKPTSDVHIREVRLLSSTGSCLAFGSEMSGGISNVLVENIELHDSFTGIEVKTARGRGGYIEDILLSGAKMENVKVAIRATGQFESHPDDKYDPHALPVVKGISFKDIIGTNITMAGNFSGISDSPFTAICLSNISFNSSTSAVSASWVCSNVSGFSENVYPEPCPALKNSYATPSSCSFLLYPSSRVEVL